MPVKPPTSTIPDDDVLEGSIFRGVGLTITPEPPQTIVIEALDSEEIRTVRLSYPIMDEAHYQRQRWQAIDRAAARKRELTEREKKRQQRKAKQQAQKKARQTTRKARKHS